MKQIEERIDAVHEDGAPARANGAAVEGAGALPFDEPAPAAQAAADDVIVLSRVTLNYLTIAVTFFVLGIVLGAVALRRVQEAGLNETREIAREVAAAIVAGQAAGGASLTAGTATGSTTDAGHSGGDTTVRFAVDAGDNPVLGPPDAPLLLVEFSDFQCPFCGRFARETLHPLLEDYGDQIRYAYRDFPILGSTSLDAALAAECADDQGGFWEYHDLLFANQEGLSRATFIDFAAQLDLDVETFTTCLDEEIHRDAVIADFQTAQQLGATGTPTFFLNGRLISGAQPYAVFASVIEEELAALNSSAGESENAQG